MTARVTARMLSAYEYLLRFGYTDNGSAAIVGNGCGESGPNLDSTFERINADHGSGGFLEWRDSAGAPRKTRLASFADARGPGLRNDLDTQCDYAIWELQKYFPALDQQLRNPGRTIKNLTANFCWVFENPAPATAGLDNRIAYAEAVAVRAAEIKTPQAPQPAPPMPLPSPPIPTMPMAPAGLPPISAAVAGRQTAVLDNLQGMLAAYEAERAAYLESIDKEIAIVKTTLADFGKLATMIVPAALPKPEADKSVVPVKTNPITQRITMNPQVSATLRSILLALGGAAVSKGVIDQSTLISIVGGAISAISYGWSLWGHSKTSIISAAASLPEVQKIVTTTAIAESAQFAANPTVVSTMH